MRIPKVRVAMLVDDLLETIFHEPSTKANYIKRHKEIASNNLTSYYLAQIFLSEPLIVINVQTKALTFYGAQIEFYEQSERVLVQWFDLNKVFEQEFDNSKSTKQTLIKQVQGIVDNKADVSIEDLPIAKRPSQEKMKTTIVEDRNDVIVSPAKEAHIFSIEQTTYKVPWAVRVNTYQLEQPYRIDVIQERLRNFLESHKKRLNPKQFQKCQASFNQMLELAMFLLNADSKDWLLRLHNDFGYKLYHRHFPADEIVDTLLKYKIQPTFKQRRAINNRVFYVAYKLGNFNELTSQKYDSKISKMIIFDKQK